MQQSRSLTRRFHGNFIDINAEWADALSDSELKGLQNWQQATPADAINDNPQDTSHVYRVGTSRGGIIFKRYRPRSKWRYFLRPSRAANEWAGLQAFRSAGIPVPPLVAYGESRSFGGLDAAFIITGEIVDARDLASFAAAQWVNLLEPDRKAMFEEVKGKLLEIVRMAHFRKLYHQDLVWRNILIRKRGDQFDLWLIDCPRFKSTRKRNRHAELVDLSGLARVALSLMSTPQRLRTLVEYCEGEREQARNLFRAIDRHHRRSRHPPRLFDPATAEYYPNPDYS